MALVAGLGVSALMFAAYVLAQRSTTGARFSSLATNEEAADAPLEPAPRVESCSALVPTNATELIAVPRGTVATLSATGEGRWKDHGEPKKALHGERYLALPTPSNPESCQQQQMVTDEHGDAYLMVD